MTDDYEGMTLALGGSSVSMFSMGICFLNWYIAHNGHGHWS